MITNQLSAADAAAERHALRGRLTTFKVIVMVVAAVAPMSTVVGYFPLAFMLGSGYATPVTYVLAGVVMVMFAVGYGAIARRISAAGGFYSYIAKGLGRPAGGSAGLVATVAYNALVALLIAGLGYFGNLVVQQQLNLDVPWWAISGAGVALAGVLGYTSVDLAGLVVSVLIAAEIGLIVVLDVAVVASKGLAAFPLAALDPSHIFTTGSLGIGMMFAFASFTGFESAAIYAEETVDPKRSIPRATIGAAVVVSVFYALTSWITVGAIGTGNVAADASEAQGDLVFGISQEFAGHAMTVLLSVAVVSSMFASQLSLHNATSRYMFALGRERMLPSWMGASHPRLRTPSRASLVQTAFSAVVLAVFALLGLDPYLSMVTIATGLGAMGIVLLQAGAAAAIVAYFWRRREQTGLVTIVVTAVSCCVFVALTVLILLNFKLLTGATSDTIYVLPVLLLLMALGGAAHALWLRRHRPEDYALIGSFTGDE
ncbi:APC family permease [Streptomyces sp. NPDC001914]|uniref:APC family permease n=1 Tax=Streptomyces sp. NPDC001914 TaxID=3364623 RepID=UPI0036C75033